MLEFMSSVSAAEKAKKKKKLNLLREKKASAEESLVQQLGLVSQEGELCVYLTLLAGIHKELLEED